MSLKSLGFSSITAISITLLPISLPTLNLLEPVFAQTTPAKPLPTIRLEQIVGEYEVVLDPMADALKEGVRSLTGRWIIKSNGTFETYLKAVFTNDEVQEIRTFGRMSIKDGKIISQVEKINGEKPDQVLPIQSYTLSSDGNELQADDQPVKLVKYSSLGSHRAQTTQDRRAEAVRLINQGIQQFNISQFEAAFQSWQQALTIYREIKDRRGEGNILGTLGLAYFSLGKYDKAIEFQLQRLAIAREIEDRSGEGAALRNLGNAYSSLGKYDKEIEFVLQSLAIERESNDRFSEEMSLRGLAVAHEKLNRAREAMISYQQALTIAREIGDRSGEGLILANLGNVLSKVKRPELAILFYKQSINIGEANRRSLIREIIRKHIRTLDTDIQKSYLAAVGDTYRNLADLLLKQDRILEAQQVLDLLKVEELNEYLRTPIGSEKTEQGTELRTPEKTFIALALELDELQQRKLANNITAVEQERLNKLVKSEQEQNNQFIAFLDSDPVQKLVDELRLKEKQQNVDITNNYQNLRTDILSKYPNAVLLYPLILEDRLELILVTAKTTPIRRTINIKREKLNREITDFLAGLRDASSQDVKAPAQQIYTWLIKPFETELAELKIDTIIYAPDGQLRYIPLAALYDGKQ